MRTVYFARASARAIALFAIALGTLTAVAGESPTATVTATPPAHAPVKPLTSKQAHQRRCEYEAQQQHLVDEQRAHYVEACMKLKASS